MEMMIMPIALIMAGGKGERLWPLSTSKKPKQFTALMNKTFFQMTVDRVLPLVGEDGIYVVTQENFKSEILKEVPFLLEKNIIFEPVGRNTAPCIGLGALTIARENPNEVMIVIPSDHLIFDEERFREIISFACEVGMKDYLITIGIAPTEAHTGYGYIHYGDEKYCKQDIKACQVLRFIEKPDIKKANYYFSNPSYLWNSGIFIWKAQTILEEITTHMPDLFQGLNIIQHYWGTPELETMKSQVFNTLPSISIDYGIMEKSERVLVIPASFQWNDIGSWLALEKVFSQDKSKNLSIGPNFSLQSQNNIIYSQKPIITFGVNDLIIVETDSAILVMPKSFDQKIKELIQELKTSEQFRHLT
jgi:mannose-1-phosphate guanylyltransferase